MIGVSDAISQESSHPAPTLAKRCHLSAQVVANSSPWCRAEISS